MLFWGERTHPCLTSNLHFINSDVQLFCSKCGKIFIAIQYHFIMAFYQHTDFLVKCIGVICFGYLRWHKTRKIIKKIITEIILKSMSSSKAAKYSSIWHIIVCTRFSRENIFWDISHFLQNNPKSLCRIFAVELFCQVYTCLLLGKCNDHLA